MKLTDYLLLRTPEVRMEGRKGKLPEPGKVPPLRVAVSFAGIIVGIVASFYITGLKPLSPPADAVPSAQVNATDQAKLPASGPPSNPQIATDPSRPFWKVFVISLVICALTYPGLYFTLHLYSNQAVFLVLLVSFQYGYFWQSAVEGGRVLLK